MSLIAKEPRKVWDALRASKRQRDDYLPEIRIRKLRGLWNLRFEFEYPVSVLAGPNGSGKSTVLFAYGAPGSGGRDITPGKLFPNFASRQQAV